MAQERVEKRLELKNGTVLTGYVDIQQDGSYLLETQAGDVFFFMPSEVSRIMSIMPQVQNQQASLEYYGGKTVDKRRGKIYMLATDQELTQSDFMTYEGWEKYQRAKRTRKTGNILLISAGGLAVTGVLVGGIFAIIEGDEDPMIVAGVGFALAAPAAVAGLICSLVGNKKLKIIEKNYNQRPGYALEFGAQQYGVGLSLKF